MADDLGNVDRSWRRERAKRELLLRVGRTLARWRIVRVKNGHYYSPVPSFGELEADEKRIFDTSLRPLPGIELNGGAQLALLDRFAAFYAEQPFPESPRSDVRYYFDNYWYDRSDALILYSMIRHFRPRQIVEIGSGFSSAVMLDTNERFMNRSMRLTFIEPESARLRKLLRVDDQKAVSIVERRIQQLDSSIIDELGAHDILFIDSSHVSKAGSDVNHIVFELLPRLKSGVLVHFHDIRYPFEYPKEWFALGISWNEAYVLRAFLQFNKEFPITFWNDYMLKFHADAIRQRMPLCLGRSGFGVHGSLWLQRADR
jgi:predicted O-methyltransferase YrrM